MGRHIEYHNMSDEIDACDLSHGVHRLRETGTVFGHVNTRRDPGENMHQCRAKNMKDGVG